jgi:hypothetical protein
LGYARNETQSESIRSEISNINDSNDDDDYDDDDEKLKK